MKFLLVLTFVLSSFSSYITYAKFSNILKKEKFPTIDIPDSLLFGAGTSAIQIEGALKSHGRAESAIELFLSQNYTDPLSGSLLISSDSYHRYKEDIGVLKYIGLDLYRFSMSWARLLPTGHADQVNQEGVKYYHDLLNELNGTGIEPMVQLHHFDHPAVFEKTGGWKNESMIELFKDYARLVFKEYGHRVKYFLTFNEPNVMCNLWESGLLTTDGKLNSTFPRVYNCSHNVLKAHAEAYHLYHDEFNSDKKGAISINLLCNDHIAREAKNRHLENIAFAFGCGWFADPIFSTTGDYSDLLKQRVKESDALRSNNSLLLPTFSQDWIDRIRGTADFFALSYYSARLIDEASDYESSVNYFMPAEAQLVMNNLPNWQRTLNDNYIVANGLRTVLKEIKKKYNNPTVHIVENGMADDGRLNDNKRMKFIYRHVKQIIAAINVDHCNVRSYIYWSLIDNYEFWGGFRMRFGLAHVNISSPYRTRTPKKSARWLQNVLHTRKLYIKE